MTHQRCQWPDLKGHAIYEYDRVHIRHDGRIGTLRIDNDKWDNPRTGPWFVDLSEYGLDNYIPFCDFTTIEPRLNVTRVMTRTPPRKAPFKDRTGRTMYEGDTVTHHKKYTGKLVCLPSGTGWRVSCADRTIEPVPIKFTDRCTLIRAPRAITVRQFWKDNGTPGYKVSLDGEPMLLTDAEYLNYAIAHVMPSRP